MGLVGQVVSALKRQNIQRLTKTYLTVPLSTVTEKHNFKDQATTGAYLLKMVRYFLTTGLTYQIENGSLNATLHEETGILAFSDSDEAYNTNSTIDYLGKQIQSAIVLHQQIAAVDREIELSDKFIQKLLMQERGSSKHAPNDDAAMEAFMSVGFSG